MVNPPAFPAWLVPVAVVGGLLAAAILGPLVIGPPVPAGAPQAAPTAAVWPTADQSRDDAGQPAPAAGQSRDGASSAAEGAGQSGPAAGNYLIPVEAPPDAASAPQAPASSWAPPASAPQAEPAELQPIAELVPIPTAAPALSNIDALGCRMTAQGAQCGGRP